MDSTIVKLKLIYPDMVLEWLRNGGYILKKYTGHSETMVIPSCIKHIKPCCFIGNKSIKTVRIMCDGEVDIGKAAFKDSSISKIEIPSRSYKLGSSVFSNCKNLHDIDLTGCTWIERMCFSGAGLCSVDLTGSSIGTDLTDEEKMWNAFEFNVELTEVKLTGKIKCISNAMFNGCNNLADISIPEGVEVLGPYAFGSVGIKEMVLPSSVRVINNWAFYGSKVEHLIIKGKNLILDNMALNNMSNLKRITAGKEVIELLKVNRQFNKQVEFGCIG